MATAENALIRIEAAQTAYAMAALTDSGDHKVFAGAAAPWSKQPGFAPSILPNGIRSGGAVIPAASLANNQVDVAAISANLNGVVTAIAAATNIAITRPATNVSKVNSITVNAAGSVVAVAGTDGASSAFSETRGAAGGPPLIPVDSIEVAQVRVTTSAAAVITAAQIYALPGTHTELVGNYTVDYFDGKVSFATALPLIHTGPTAKKVFASFSTPSYTDLDKTSDFKAPEESYSSSSTQYYGGTLGATSKSLGQGGFKSYLDNGVSDPLIGYKGTPRWIEFYPDRYSTGYKLEGNGIIGVARSFPANNQIVSECTITAEEAFREVVS